MTSTLESLWSGASSTLLSEVEVHLRVLPTLPSRPKLSELRLPRVQDELRRLVDAECRQRPSVSSLVLLLFSCSSKSALERTFTRKESRMKFKHFDYRLSSADSEVVSVNALNTLESNEANGPFDLLVSNRGVKVEGRQVSSVLVVCTKASVGMIKRALDEAICSARVNASINNSINLFILSSIQSLNVVSDWMVERELYNPTPKWILEMRDNVVRIPNVAQRVMNEKEQSYLIYLLQMYRVEQILMRYGIVEEHFKLQPIAFGTAHQPEVLDQLEKELPADFFNRFLAHHKKVLHTDLREAIVARSSNIIDANVAADDPNEDSGVAPTSLMSLELGPPDLRGRLHALRQDRCENDDEVDNLLVTVNNDDASTHLSADDSDLHINSQSEANNDDLHLPNDYFDRNLNVVIENPNSTTRDSMNEPNDLALNVYPNPADDYDYNDRDMMAEISYEEANRHDSDNQYDDRNHRSSNFEKNYTTSLHSNSYCDRSFNNSLLSHNPSTHNLESVTSTRSRSPSYFSRSHNHYDQNLESSNEQHIFNRGLQHLMQEVRAQNPTSQASWEEAASIPRFQVSAPTALHEDPRQQCTWEYQRSQQGVLEQQQQQEERWLQQREEQQKREEEILRMEEQRLLEQQQRRLEEEEREQRQLEREREERRRRQEEKEREERRRKQREEEERLRRRRIEEKERDERIRRQKQREAEERRRKKEKEDEERRKKEMEDEERRRKKEKEDEERRKKEKEDEERRKKEKEDEERRKKKIEDEERRKKEKEDEERRRQMEKEDEERRKKEKEDEERRKKEIEDEERRREEEKEQSNSHEQSKAESPSERSLRGKKSGGIHEPQISGLINIKPISSRRTVTKESMTSFWAMRPKDSAEVEGSTECNNIPALGNDCNVIEMVIDDDDDDDVVASSIQTSSTTTTTSTFTDATSSSVGSATLSLSKGKAPMNAAKKHSLKTTSTGDDAITVRDESKRPSMDNERFSHSKKASTTVTSTSTSTSLMPSKKGGQSDRSVPKSSSTNRNSNRFGASGSSVRQSSRPGARRSSPRPSSPPRRTSPRRLSNPPRRNSPPRRRSPSRRRPSASSRSLSPSKRRRSKSPTTERPILGSYPMAESVRPSLSSHSEVFRPSSSFHRDEVRPSSSNQMSLPANYEPFWLRSPSLSFAFPRLGAFFERFLDRRQITDATASNMLDAWREAGQTESDLRRLHEEVGDDAQELRRRLMAKLLLIPRRPVTKVVTSDLIDATVSFLLEIEAFEEAVTVVRNAKTHHSCVNETTDHDNRPEEHQRSAVPGSYGSDELHKMDYNRNRDVEDINNSNNTVNVNNSSMVLSFSSEFSSTTVNSLPQGPLDAQSFSQSIDQYQSRSNKERPAHESLNPSGSVKPTSSLCRGSINQSQSAYESEPTTSQSLSRAMPNQQQSINKSPFGLLLNEARSTNQTIHESGPLSRPSTSEGTRNTVTSRPQMESSVEVIDIEEESLRKPALQSLDYRVSLLTLEPMRQRIVQELQTRPMLATVGNERPTAAKIVQVLVARGLCLFTLISMMDKEDKETLNIIFEDKRMPSGAFSLVEEACTWIKRNDVYPSTSLSSLSPRLSLVLLDAFGSSFVRHRLGLGHPEELKALLKTLVSNIISFATSPHGIISIDDLILNGDVGVQTPVLQALYPHLRKLSTDAVGHRLVVQALRSLPDRMKCIVADELKESLTSLLYDQYGSTVVQTLVQCLEDVDFVCHAVRYKVDLYARHVYAHLAVVKLIERQTQGKLSRSLLTILDEVVASITILAVDNYGSRVVRALFGHGRRLDKEAVKGYVLNNALRLLDSKDTFDLLLYVVTQISREDCCVLLSDLCSPNWNGHNYPLLLLATHALGYVVLLHLLDSAHGQPRKAALIRLRTEYNAIENNEHGRKVLHKIAGMAI